eukprot:CAMPEP_0119531444 /NCGR_PEP_ID=MMETSP1344-20130328/45142_1 /TAXON_ID=236787 /ORGANISM="Florenciella parvula, Strain CCMP2471" /LENGTH=412 /DNA_ID=CAMNT_0007571699 /DNA_START=79 /DNA_END=1313 /DNA_ORIENTATION=-
MADGSYDAPKEDLRKSRIEKKDVPGDDFNLAKTRKSQKMERRDSNTRRRTHLGKKDTQFGSKYNRDIMDVLAESNLLDSGYYESDAESDGDNEDEDAQPSVAEEATDSMFAPGGDDTKRNSVTLRAPQGGQTPEDAAGTQLSQGAGPGGTNMATQKARHRRRASTSMNMTATTMAKDLGIKNIGGSLQLRQLPSAGENFHQTNGSGNFEGSRKGSIRMVVPGRRGSAAGGRRASDARSFRTPVRQVSTVELEDGQIMAMDLEIILNTDMYFLFFMEHLQGEYNSENLIFWKAVDKMKQRKEFEKHHGIKMVKTFIEIGATLQVNISAAEREKIEAEAQLEGDMIRPDLFDDAQQQVYTMLKNDLYPRFRNGPSFEKMLNAIYQMQQEEADANTISEGDEPTSPPAKSSSIPA